MKNSVYKNVLGLPESVGTISFVNTQNLFNEKSYFSFASATDAPSRKWAEGTSAEEMTKDMENDGWTCEFKKDGFGKLCAACVHINTQKIIDAAKKSNAAIFKNAEKGFLRFGDLPKNGKSKNFANGNFEAGVSTFNAEFSGNNYRPILTDVLEITYLNVVSRPAYRVWGKVVGTGADGEPLLKVTKFVKLN
jgi:hypothetical protein